MNRWIISYSLAFLVLTAADVASTLWASATGPGQEFNAAAASSNGGLDLERLLLINLAILAVTAAMLAWGLRNRASIDPRYLAQPRRALLNILYLNPFLARNKPRAAFHYTALAPAMLGMKAIAACNNSLIAAGMPDVITPLAMAVRQLASATLTYWIVVFLLFLPVWYASLAGVARLLRPGLPAGTRPAVAG